MDATPNEPIRRRKLSDEVLDRLLDQLRSGALQPGDQLPPERELMAQFGVGRPAVREAMQSLASMGLITISHGERARVSSLTVSAMIDRFDATARLLLSASTENIDHLVQARLFFETGMVRMAAARSTPEDIAHLENLINDMERQQTGADFIASDMAFHYAIADMTGNPIFAAAARGMLHWLKDYHVAIVSFQGAEDVTLREHREITRYLSLHDVEGAARAMGNHLTRASELYRLRPAQR
ncbi:transcriptional regulator NanR [Kushneria aurantia]|uniref:Transcriptional regulator NanR n=1 Tax=Kushneria aurantia TaxID=504092 RepID=A0ABV6G0J4_9GAMM|nr:transcriptional regulator NanR [Kushneria aurantia]